MQLEDVHVGRTWLYIMNGEEGVRYAPVDSLVPKYNAANAVEEKIVAFKGIPGEHKLSEVLSHQDEWRVRYPREPADPPRTLRTSVAKASGSDTWLSS